VNEAVFVIYHNRWTGYDASHTVPGFFCPMPERLVRAGSDVWVRRTNFHPMGGVRGFQRALVASVEAGEALIAYHCTITNCRIYVHLALAHLHHLALPLSLSAHLASALDDAARIFPSGELHTRTLA
jgi:hypothetical protein